MNPHNKARVITVKEEEMLWQAGILGSATPKTLVETLLYLFGLHFALHTGNEHRSLGYIPNLQLKVKLNPECDLRYLEYTEDCSKNNQGALIILDMIRK